MIRLLVLVVVSLAVLNVARPWEHRSRPLDRPGTPAPFPAIEFVVGGPVWGGIAVVAGLYARPLLPVVLAAPTARRWWDVRVARARRGRDIVRTLPDVIDILLVGIRSGLNPRAALAVGQSLLPAPWDRPVADALRRAESGASLADSLAAVEATLGSGSRPLVAVLKTGALTGTGLASQLEELRAAAQRRRRIDASTRAQRLPVLMLGPLVCCVLPAFVLVAIAPLLIASLGDLGLGL